MGCSTSRLQLRCVEAHHRGPAAIQPRCFKEEKAGNAEQSQDASPAGVWDQHVEVSLEIAPVAPVRSSRAASSSRSSSVKPQTVQQARAEDRATVARGGLSADAFDGGDAEEPIPLKLPLATRNMELEALLALGTLRSEDITPLCCIRPIVNEVELLPAKPVKLHIYDVSTWAGIQVINRIMAHENALLKLGGLFHTGVEVDGVEWSFGFSESMRTGVYCSEPKMMDEHHYREEVPLGFTELSSEEILLVMAQLAAKYPGSSYCMLSNNCCTFADELCQCLGVQGFPDWVHRLARIGAKMDGLLPTIFGNIPCSTSRASECRNLDSMSICRSLSTDGQQSDTVRARSLRRRQRSREFDGPASAPSEDAGRIVGVSSRDRREPAATVELSLLHTCQQPELLHASPTPALLHTCRQPDSVGDWDARFASFWCTV